MSASAFLSRAGSTCRGCRGLIGWGITEGGARMAVNVAGDLQGRIAVYVDGAGTVRLRTVSAAAPILSYEELHVAHAATCTGAVRGKAPAAPKPTAAPRNVIPIYRAREARAQRAAKHRGHL